MLLLINLQVRKFCYFTCFRILISYKYFTILGFALAYSVVVVVLPEPATALILISPVELIIADCSMVTAIIPMLNRFNITFKYQPILFIKFPDILCQSF